MIRIGVFTGSGQYPKPEPVIVKTKGVNIDPELIVKIASSPPKNPDKNK